MLGLRELLALSHVPGPLKMYAVYCEVSPDIREGALSGNLAAGLRECVPSLIGP